MHGLPFGNGVKTRGTTFRTQTVEMASSPVRGGARKTLDRSRLGPVTPTTAVVGSDAAMLVHGSDAADLTWVFAGMQPLSDNSDGSDDDSDRASDVPESDGRGRPNSENGSEDESGANGRDGSAGAASGGARANQLSQRERKDVLAIPEYFFFCLYLALERPFRAKG